MKFYCPNGKRLPVPTGYFGSAGGCYLNNVLTEPCTAAGCQCERSAIELCYTDYLCDTGLPLKPLQVHVAPMWLPLHRCYRL